MVKQKKLHFFIIDDDQDLLDLYTTLLEAAGHKVTARSSSVQALEQIIDLQPDCVLSDLIMPGLDGFDLFNKIRQNKNIKQPKFIVVTSKKFEFDRQHALQLGVNGYLTKPINPKTFVDEILELIGDKLVVQFWGVRGTLPVPGRDAVRYGGNTNCVTLNFPDKHFFIFDAGTGIKALSNHLIKENKFPLSAKIFITHPHWDHINALPFFVPFYMKGNEFEILTMAHDDMSVEKLLFNQMEDVYFPVTTREFSAKLLFRNIKEEEFYIDDIHIMTLLLNHPGQCLGFRVQYKNKAFCYITDNELYLENSPQYNQFDLDRLIHFIHGADILIIDTSYSDDEYVKKINWGHSCVSRVIDVADQAKVKLVCLYHHDPDQVDADIDRKLKQAQAILKSRHSKMQCIAPHEDDEIFI